MQTHLSPKDLATVVGVSESSLKRWVDDGRLSAERTSGGHRRIPIPEAVRFIRETAAEIAEPSLLGLAELDSAVVANSRRGGAERALMSSLGGGRTDEAVGILLLEFLRSRVVGSVCDGPIAMALNHAAEPLGAAGAHSNGQASVAAAAVGRALGAISRLLAVPPLDAPTAEVRALGADTALGAAMSTCVLQESGYRVRTEANDPGLNGTVGPGTRVACVVLGSAGSAGPEQLVHGHGPGIDMIVCGPGAAAIAKRPGIRCALSMCELGSLSRLLRQPAASVAPRQGRAVRMA